MAYSGKWVPKNISKYRGDPKKITYRSNWEKFFFEWL
ncbi:head completion protein, partial [Salmonella enterica subsp. enterica serovar Braenderup]|nr:head completion protein [Salmonella enterica subsp. enterica serovar Braenderup]